MPFFSIIIPTYNRADLISPAIDSVLNQSFKDFELIVVDDGSQDDTIELLTRKYLNRIHYVHQANQGVCAARNHGARLASGEYLVFLDSDDRLALDSLGEYARCLVSKNIKLVLGFAIFENSKGRSPNKRIPIRNGKKFNHPLTGSFAIDRNLFLQQGGYDEKLSFSETSDFFLRLSLQGGLEESELMMTIQAGVLIQETNQKQRIQRYGLKKYESVKYFLDKHRQFLKKNPKQFLNFKRIHGMCALQNNLFEESRKCFWQVLKVTPWSWRSYFHVLIVTLAPRLAKSYYGR